MVQTFYNNFNCALILFLFVPSDVCIDYIVYPCPIENAFVYKNGNFSNLFTGNPNDNFFLEMGIWLLQTASSINYR